MNRAAYFAASAKEVFTPRAPAFVLVSLPSLLQFGSAALPPIRPASSSQITVGILAVRKPF